jgi:diguanylate cyclase (GGDEF)-like protein/PAS domain S-box-containing protein
MANRTERNLRAGALVVFLILTVMGGVVYQSTRRLLAANAQLAHPQQVLLRLEALQNAVGTVQNALRGYIDESDPNALRRYQEAVNRIPSLLVEIDAMTADTPGVHAKVQELNPEMKSTLAMWADIASRVKTESPAAVDRILTLEGTLNFLRTDHRLISVMSQEQNQLLAASTLQDRTSARHAVLIEMIVVGIAIVLLSTAYWALWRDMNQKVKAYEVGQESEQKLRLLLASTAEAIYGIDREGKCTFCNPACLSILGYRSAEELIGCNMHERVHHSHADGSPYPVGQCQIFTAFRENRGTHADSEVLWRADGTSFPAEYWSYPIRRGNQVIGAVVTFLDISERVRAERNLHEAHASLNRALRDSQARANENMVLSDLTDLFQSCQTVAEACKISETALPRIFGSRPGALGIINASRDAVEAVASWNSCSSTEPAFAPQQCWALRRGRIHVVPEAGSPLRCAHVRGTLRGGYLCQPLAAQGETLGILYLEDPAPDGSLSPEAADLHRQELLRQAAAAGQRISLALANLRLREILRNQSIRDPVTGLFNRRYMEESLERELHRAARKKRTVALVMLDLDDYKTFNDTFGHQAGDLLLREVSAILKSRVRKGDVACRYGGDEFALIISEADVEGARSCVLQIREEIAQLNLHHRGQDLRTVTVSGGIAVFPLHGENAEDLMRAADNALYRAKREGKDRVIIGSPVSEEV